MSLESDDGHSYRLLQVKKILALFKGARGRDARTVEGLDKWIGSPKGKAALAYDHDPDGKIIADPFETP
jgi:hypothetical protein